MICASDLASWRQYSSSVLLPFESAAAAMSRGSRDSPHKRCVCARQARARQERLDAIYPAAVARSNIQPTFEFIYIRLKIRQRRMPPLACYSVRSLDEATVCNDAAPYARSENDAEGRVRACCCAIDRLRQRKTVGIVRNPHAIAETTLEIGQQWSAVQPRRVAVFHQPRRRFYGTRRSGTDGASLPCDSIEHFDQPRRQSQRWPRSRTWAWRHALAPQRFRHH